MTRTRQDYKPTIWGLIPTEWNLLPFGALVREFRGGAPLKPSDFTETGVKVLPKGGVIRGGLLRIEEYEQQYCSGEYARRYHKNSVDETYTIVVLRDLVPSGPAIGLMVKIQEPEHYILAQGVYGFKLQEDKAIPEYLIQLSNSQIYRGLIHSIMVGSTQVHVTNTALKELLFPLPPTLDEQRAIANALSEVDDRIASLDDAIAKKRDLKQGAMQRLLTGEERLPGFSGEWASLQFENLADDKQPWAIVGGPFGSNLKVSDYTNEGVRIIQLQNIGDNFFVDDYAIYTTEQKADDLKASNIYPGDIILSKMGDPVARACFVPNVDKRYLMASDGIRLAVDERRFDKHFVLYYINSYFRPFALQASTGSTRQRIALNDLKKLPFVAPSLEEQRAIGAILLEFDEEIKALEAERNKTIALKQGMMQDLLTGKVRLV